MKTKSLNLLSCAIIENEKTILKTGLKGNLKYIKMGMITKKLLLD